MSEHGTRSHYVHHGCRCDECRRANARYQAEGKSNRRSEQVRLAERVEIDGWLVHPSPYGGHGSLTAYTSCGCRCGACRETKSAYERSSRISRKA